MVHPGSSGPSPIPRPADSAARRLHPSSHDAVVLDTAVLREIATGLAEAIDHVDEAPAHSIQRISLLATEGYDAWLMVWGPGATLEPHDHDGSIGVLHVIQGQILETSAGLEDPDLAPLRCLDPGDTTEFAAGVRHALFNSGEATAVSVGVYSPPISAAA